MKIHNNKKIWYKYIIPKRLTIESNPIIYRWLWWVWDGEKYPKNECIFWVVSIIIILISGITTSYFGYKWWPQSKAEWTIDMSLLIAMGVNIKYLFKKR